jgi:hypothetical protein
MGARKTGGGGRALGARALVAALGTALGAALAVAVPQPAFADTTIDITGLQDRQWGQFGYEVPTFGETVTVPAGETTLTSFVFEIEAPSTRIFRGEVYAWDAAHQRPTGNPLWESAQTHTGGNGWEEVTFEPGVAVTPGQQVVLFVTISRDYEANSPDDAAYIGGVADNVYPGGTEVTVLDGGDEGKWTTVAWTQYISELAFRAQFGKPDVAGLAPTISGRAQVGQTLAADAGSVVPADSTLGYQWTADGVDIAGANGPTLLLTRDLAGARIRVRVTASHDGYDPGTETSAATPYVRALVAKPRIRLDDATPARGQTVAVLAQGLQPGSTYRLYNRWLPHGGSVARVADQYGEIHLRLAIPVDAPLGYDVVGISGAWPLTAAFAMYSVQRTR